MPALVRTFAALTRTSDRTGLDSLMHTICALPIFGRFVRARPLEAVVLWDALLVQFRARDLDKITFEVNLASLAVLRRYSGVS